MGRKGAAEIEKQVPRALDPRAEAKLAVIASKLTPYLRRSLEYDVRILAMKEPNAFSLPGGKTYFTTGMLEFLKSEDEIAAVMSHEFIHADRAHGIIQAARDARLSLLTVAGLVAAAYAGGSAAGGIAAMAGGVQTALSNSYGIELEKEADAMGIDVLRKAGYNPAAMLTITERLKLEKMRRAQYRLGIFQTHPDEEERIDAALKYMRDNGIEVQRRDVVKALRVSADAASGDARLSIDGNTIMSAPQSAEATELFERVSARLDDNLELELAPYDIKISNLNGEEELIIKRETILKQSELLPGLPALSVVRDRINDAINDARRGNLLTDYYE